MGNQLKVLNIELRCKIGDGGSSRSNMQKHLGDDHSRSIIRLCFRRSVCRQLGRVQLASKDMNDSFGVRAVGTNF